MKPHVQKLPLSENTSFVARTYRTPQFEVGWHQHIEYELILFTSGSGMAFIGNYIGDFEVDDIFLLGSNLPHTFQKRVPHSFAGAVVVQFCDDFWGEGFLRLPESQNIKSLLEQSAYGFKVGSKLKTEIRQIIIAMETAKGFRRVLMLAECLHKISESDDLIPVSTERMEYFNHKEQERIDQVFKYTINHFREHITLEEIASVACMSVPAFCNYFKQRTRKTYIDYLNEIKISFACKQLLETYTAVADICYECGFNTPANFYKQFTRQKGLTPLQFRKKSMQKGNVNI